VLRQKASYWVQLAGKDWQSYGRPIERAGQSRWFGQALLTMRHDYRTNLLADWKPGEKEPWLLATNLPNFQAALSVYRRLDWIEEMSSDLRKHGSDLEGARWGHFLRLSRLTLAVASLNVWLVSFGSQVIKNGRRYLVDPRGRTDLSELRIGGNTKSAPDKSTPRSLLPGIRPIRIE
jgi:hypothetical protein